ncbi:hypothetical protein EJK80_06185 [Corynebacterium phoceense]|uniref:Uncharacterized protein n=1 Tax=Corynebacterium phoceense TaxID=1686286 RepID=A0A540R872_9CORY|nr:hypothetical protein [Corynebacterium phoceense]TQE43594.1 hypothetical protein EJK80_06185 [Corynebacterium phoceense]
MTDTIEVPISLIKAGDLGAIRELLPKPESLFGRWAEHPEYGRGIIISAHPDQFNAVWLAREKVDTSGKAWQAQVYLESLTLDPVELTTVEDFENAPEGTIVAAPQGNAYQKVFAKYWESYNDELDAKEMAASSPWKILRWGWGEQQ